MGNEESQGAEICAFVAKWALSTAAAFVAFPIVFVLWKGPDADFGWVGGMMLMFFIQFISPYPFWIVPLGMGFLACIIWHLVTFRSGGEPLDPGQ